MIRPSPTWISLPAHEAYRILQAIHIQRAALLQCAATDVDAVNDTDAADEDCESVPSPTWSSSFDHFTLPELDMRSLGLCPGYYLTTSSPAGSDSRDPIALPNFNGHVTSENTMPARLLNTERRVSQDEEGGGGGSNLHPREIEIPNATSSPSQQHLEEPPSEKASLAAAATDTDRSHTQPPTSHRHQEAEG